MTNEYENLEQIEDTVIKRIEDRELRVKDLGRVVWAQKEREIATRADGAESVQVDIYKEADANIVAVAKRAPFDSSWAFSDFLKSLTIAGIIQSSNSPIRSISI